MTDRMVCQSCSEQRKELHVHDSSLIKGFKMTLCNVCIGKDYEPRHIVMIALAQFGMTDQMKKVINNELYHGEKITLSEFLSVDK